MSEEENEKQPTIFINVNLFKVNLSMMIVCVLLSYFKEEYEYIRIVYNCLVTLLIYNNLIFIYVVYKNLKGIL